MISPAASRPSPDSPSRAIASHRAPRSRSVWSYVAGGIGNVLAAGGVVCVALVILAVSMNISLIMFKTGSMSPEIPADSVAVVKEISADEVRVGDVITVDRDEWQLPVTHRVLEVHPQTPGEALVQMQGDANPSPDPGLYRVETARKVLWSVPELAKVIVWFGSPWVLGGATVLASLAVLWAFWPRNDDEILNERSASYAVVT